MKLTYEEIKELVKEGKCVKFVADNIEWNETLVIGRYNDKYIY